MTFTTTVSELVDLLPARLVAGKSATRICGFAALAEAKDGDLSFFSNPRYRESFADTKASAVLVPHGWDIFPTNVSCLAVENPSEAFGRLVDEFGSKETTFQPGIHPSAVLGAKVTGRRDRISVGANAVIEDGVHIGDETEIGAGCFVGRGARLGAQCKLFANVAVQHDCILGDRVTLHPGAVIGGDGFGYEFVDGRHQKIAQIGIVQIDNDVEIGSCTTVDRARIGITRIGEGTKIDNLVQIGHNVVIGKHCIIVAQTGIAGSAVIGDYVVIAAQSGVAGHVNVGSHCTLSGRSGVTKSLPAGAATYLGFPAAPVGEERRRIVAVRQLPDLISRVKDLEHKLQDKDHEK